MKKTFAIAALLPGTALAHGGHPPVSEALHGAWHAAPLVVVVLAAVALWIWWARS